VLSTLLDAAIDTTTGALTSAGLVAAGTGPTSLALDPRSKFAYVVNSGSNDVSTYTVDGTTGALTSLGTTGTGLSPASIALHPSGKFVYVTNAGSNSVWVYNIDASTGTLTLIGTIGTWRGAGSSGRALFDVFHFGGPHNLIPTQKAVSRRKPVGKRL